MRVILEKISDVCENLDIFIVRRTENISSRIFVFGAHSAQWTVMREDFSKPLWVTTIYNMFLGEIP